MTFDHLRETFLLTWRLVFHTVPFAAERQTGKLSVPTYKSLVCPDSKWNPRPPLQKQTLYLLQHKKGFKLYVDLTITLNSLAKVLVLQNVYP